MARVVGKAGASVRKMEERRRRLRRTVTLCVLAAMGALLWFIFQCVKLPGWWGASLAMAGLMLMKVYEVQHDRADRLLRKAERRARRGAGGEERVEEILGQLPDDHVVLHDLEGSYGNLDHVVLAPHGVFVIETKSQRGRLASDGSTLFLNGRPLAKDAVGQTLRNALWLKDRIKERAGSEVFVSAVLVFTSARARGPLPKLRGVRVVEAERLLGVIAETRGKGIAVEQVLSAITPGLAAEP